MFANESNEPITPTLVIQVSQLGASWRFYSKLLGFRVMKSESMPKSSLYLTLPSEDEAISPSDNKFVIELTTRKVARRVTRMRIEMGSLEDLVRVWMLSRLMEYPNAGPTLTNEGCTLALHDPDQHRIELFAPGAALAESWANSEESEFGAGDDDQAEWKSSINAHPETPSRFVLANRFSARHEWPG